MSGTRCTATSKRTGDQCGQHCAPGYTTCRWHGGAAGQVAAAAQRRVVDGQVLAAVDRLDLRDPDEVDPALALLREVDRAVAAVCWLSERIAELEPGTERHAATLDVLGSWSDRAAKVSAEVVKIGISQHRDRLAEEQVDGIVHVIEATLAELGANVRSGEVRAVVARQLRALDESEAAS